MLDRYIVDLSSYSTEERDCLYKQLHGISFVCDIIDGKAGLYEAFIEQGCVESIPDYLHIPAKYVNRA